MSAVKPNYFVDWCAGPSVQIELLSPITSDGNYLMNYTPSFRGTLRPPVTELKVGPKALNPIETRITDLIGKMEGKLRGAGSTTTTAVPNEEILEDMELLGDQLYTFLIRSYIPADIDLRKSRLYLEIGMDEDLMNFPWELVHDGNDFLCLKQYIGRFVRSKTTQPMFMNPDITLGSSLENLSILIISVPKTDPIGETKDYEPLPQAEVEAQAMCNLLSEIKNVRIQYVTPKDATFDKVYLALKRNTYDILHFCGHAYYDDQHPANSGIVLRDKIMQTGQITNTIRGRKDKKLPVLCFINACESTKTVNSTGTKTGEGNRLNIYGLARAFLDTGAYLLGSRWRVKDATAMEFARQFYTSLVKNEKSIGESVFDARNSCKDNVPADVFGWATYIYYGDPRLYFRKAS